MSDNQSENSYDFGAYTTGNVTLSGLTSGLGVGTVGGPSGAYTMTLPNMGITQGTAFSSYGSYLSGYSASPGSSVNITSEDVVIRGKSLMKTLEAICDRLAIIEEPDEEKMKKYAALRDAYERFKTIEALLNEE